MTNYDILKEYEAHKTPVPSYDHFVELTEKVKENQQLKELLKECKDYIGDGCLSLQECRNVINKIDNAIGEKK